jgi:hypothetical protein
MGGFLPKKPASAGNKTSKEAFNNKNPTSSGYDRQHGPMRDGHMGVLDVKGKGGSNIVDVKEVRVTNDTRHPMNGKWVTKSRAAVDYNHSN